MRGGWKVRVAIIPTGNGSTGKYKFHRPDVG